MEKEIALIDKATNRVKNILVVESHDDEHIQQWATDSLLVVPVIDSQAFLHGIYDGTTFATPENEYLISMGLLQPIQEPELDETKTK
jgi:hypothetical protein